MRIYRRIRVAMGIHTVDHDVARDSVQIVYEIAAMVPRFQRTSGEGRENVKECERAQRKKSMLPNYPSHFWRSRVRASLACLLAHLES